MTIAAFHEAMVETTCRRCNRRGAVIAEALDPVSQHVALNEIEISYRNEVELLRAYYDVFEEAQG